MVARVTHYQIRARKIEDFVATVESLTAAKDKLTGFRSLVVLRGEDPTSREAMAISVWDSEADMRDSDSNTHYHDVLRPDGRKSESSRIPYHGSPHRVGRCRESGLAQSCDY